MTYTLIVFCRVGFETDCIAELESHVTSRGEQAQWRFSAQQGLVECDASPDAVLRFIHTLPFQSLQFVRQWFFAIGSWHLLSVNDRVSGILDVLSQEPKKVSGVVVETPDTDEAKRLSPLCSRLVPKIERALVDEHSLISPDEPYQVHVCFTATDRAFIGYAPVKNSSPWPMGIPRLRVPRGAPSRAALKLEEALVVLVPENLARALRPGMRAVDLGAAPGGWTWLLAQRQIYVTAVDNGALAPSVRASNYVEHIRTDGFRYQPKRPVAWLVCDIVAQPVRIARLVAQWASDGLCQHALFNLKLPMKKRFAEVARCLGEIRDRLDREGVDYSLACKQLYHDRDEVTCYLRVGSAGDSRLHAARSRREEVAKKAPLHGKFRDTRRPKKPGSRVT